MANANSIIILIFWLVVVVSELGRIIGGREGSLLNCFGLGFYRIGQHKYIYSWTKANLQVIGLREASERACIVIAIRG